MIRINAVSCAFILFLTLQVAPRHVWADSGSLNPIDARAALIRGMDYFRSQQASDGSFGSKLKTSSITYNAQMIFVYEYLGLLSKKRAVISGLMEYIWSQQNSDGGFSAYPDGPEVDDLDVQSYLAAKIAGEDETSSRMLRLEKRIKSRNSLSHGTFSNLYLPLFGLKKAPFIPPGTLWMAAKLESQLPWIKVLALPSLYLFASNQIHHLSSEQIPVRLGLEDLPSESPENPEGTSAFFKWLENHTSKDGTLFNYTPTTVPALMAYWTKENEYHGTIDLALHTIEGYQEVTPDGIYQAPGIADVGETVEVLWAMADMGAPGDSMLSKAIEFTLSSQQARTGAFGFSRYNEFFPDSDINSCTIFVLTRLLNEQGNTDFRSRFVKGMEWLLTVQNDDGGFGTWEREKSRLLDEFIRKFLGGANVVLSESVVEHTARAVLALSLYRHLSDDFRISYDRAIQWLRKQQGSNGSFSGTWFVDYIFGTAMTISALGTSELTPETDEAIRKGFQFVLDHQRADGGFSESPESFTLQKPVSLSYSSPAQTGLIVAQLTALLKETHCRYQHELEPAIESAIQFLVSTQNSSGFWDDPTWTGVVFPRIEYMIYPYIQKMAPIHAIGAYLRELDQGCFMRRAPF